MGNNLKKLRESKGMTHDAAAEAMRVSRGQYIKLERGERRLNQDYILRAAKAFGVTPASVIDADSAAGADGYLQFAGVAQAGVFRQVDLLADDRPKRVSLLPDPRYRKARQYVWQIEGDSMDKAGLLPGMWAVGVDYLDFVDKYRSIENGDIVVVERLRFGGSEREITIKRYWEEPDGVALIPDSSNKKHTAIKLYLGSDPHDEQVQILAYVISAHTIFGKPLYDLDEGEIRPFDR